MAITDADFICGLMKHNTNALGFIPRPTIEERFIPRGNYVIQHNLFRKRIGYLLNGPLHKDGTLHVHQACIDLDRRLRGFGAIAWNQLLQRAIRQNARRVLLRCAEDLEAIHFWTQLGFHETHRSTGGQRRHRTIVHFEYRLPGSHVELAPTTRFSLASCQSSPWALHAARQSTKGGTARYGVRLVGAGFQSGQASLH